MGSDYVPTTPSSEKLQIKSIMIIHIQSLSYGVAHHNRVSPSGVAKGIYGRATHEYLALASH
jgi:hypothetical protein